MRCHPLALPFRENFKKLRNELSTLLFELYNDRVFENKLPDLSISWNSKMTKTAGFCRVRRMYVCYFISFFLIPYEQRNNFQFNCSSGVRSASIEFSAKVITDGARYLFDVARRLQYYIFNVYRLRCTMAHELCHAATWIFNGEKGHGSVWKQWLVLSFYL